MGALTCSAWMGVGVFKPKVCPPLEAGAGEQAGSEPPTTL